MLSRSKIPEKKTTKKVVAKKKPPRTSRDRALKSFQRLRRLEEANDEGYVRCISCGKVMNWQDAQGGHYISRGNRATDIEHDNVWPQCPKCNGVLGGNIALYRVNLIKKIGLDRVERLEHMAQANLGSDEAMALLSEEDQIKVKMKKSNAYYYEKAKEFDAELKELEGKD